VTSRESVHDYAHNVLNDHCLPFVKLLCSLIYIRRPNIHLVCSVRYGTPYQTIIYIYRTRLHFIPIICIYIYVSNIFISSFISHELNIFRLERLKRKNQRMTGLRVLFAISATMSAIIVHIHWFPASAALTVCTLVSLSISLSTCTLFLVQWELNVNAEATSPPPYFAHRNIPWSNAVDIQKIHELEHCLPDAWWIDSKLMFLPLPHTLPPHPTHFLSVSCALGPVMIIMKNDLRYVTIIVTERMGDIMRRSMICQSHIIICPPTKLLFSLYLKKSLYIHVISKVCWQNFYDYFIFNYYYFI